MQNPQPDLPTTEAGDRQWRSLYLVGGAIFLLTTVLSFVVAWGARTLYSSGYPADPASYLQLVSQHQALANLTWSLWIVLDFLALPVIVAMYLVLRRHNHTLAALASLLCLFYAVYDFGVTELNSLTLVSLSHSYAEATSAVGRDTLVAAAAYGYYALPLQTVLSFAIGPLGYLLWCVPMAKSFFGRWWAIVGAIVSLIGLAGAMAPVVPSSYILGLCQFICVRAIALWFIPLGVLLLRHGHRLGTKAG